MGEKQRHLQPLVHSPDGHTAQDWVKLKQGQDLPPDLRGKKPNT